MPYIIGTHEVSLDEYVRRETDALIAKIARQIVREQEHEAQGEVIKMLREYIGP